MSSSSDNATSTSSDSYDSDGDTSGGSNLSLPDKSYVYTGRTVRKLEVGTSVHVEEGGEADYGIVVVRGDDIDGKPALYALANKCCHGKGQLALGDIENVTDKCAHGVSDGGSSRPGLCIACPKHRKKFPGGLLFSVTEGRAFTRKETPHYNDTFRVPTYPVHVSGKSGRIYVSTQPYTHTPSLSNAEKVAIRAGKVKRNLFGRKKKKAEINWARWNLDNVEQVTHDTSIFTFTGPPPEPKAIKAIASSSNPTLWHISLKIGDIDRDYTPISSLTEYAEGVLRILIKIYPDGALTSDLDKLTPTRDQCLVTTTPAPTIALKPKKKHPSHFALIAGGTGVAPILQAARFIASHPSWTSTVLLSFQRHNDIVLHDELARLIVTGGNRIQIHVYLSQFDPDDASSDTAGLVGKRVRLSDLVRDSTTSSSTSDSNDSSAEDSSDDSSSDASSNSGDVSQSNNDTITPTVSITAGRIGRTALKKRVPLRKDKQPVTTIVSGPEGMWESLKGILVDQIGHDPHYCHGLEA